MHFLLELEGLHDYLGDVHRRGLTVRDGGRPPREFGPLQLAPNGAHRKYAQPMREVARVLPPDLGFLADVLSRMPTSQLRREYIDRIVIEGGHLHRSKVYAFREIVRRRLDRARPVPLGASDRQTLRRGLIDLTPRRVDLEPALDVGRLSTPGVCAIGATQALFGNVVAFPAGATGYPHTLVARDAGDRLELAWLCPLPRYVLRDSR